LTDFEITMQGLVAELILSDRFTLIRQLGRGGMGEVWLANDSELGEPVALKLLDSRLSASPEYIELLRLEFGRACSLVHPNIVRVFDFHAADDRYYISMQYIDGESMVSMRGAPFQPIIDKALMICDALAYAHRSSIIHSDVKASNVLLDRNGVCYLTDFGIAVADLEVRQGGGGSWPSMSPQQLAGQAASVADDVYAFGALLYELLSGQPLFHPQVTSARIRDEQPSPLLADNTGQDLPDPLAKLVIAMLDKQPERRPVGIGAVRSVLEEVRVDFPIRTGPGASQDIIQPVSRLRGKSTPAADPEPPVLKRLKPKGNSISPRLVYGGLAALIALALLVIFLLPAAVEERRSVATDAAVSEPLPLPQTEVAADPAGLAVQREIADQILGELLLSDDRLRALGITAWGGEDWLEARRLAQAGDAGYRARDFGMASTNYRQALNLMKLLEPQAASVLALALQDGVAAIDAGDQSSAIASFELALAIEPVNAAARAGLERAQQLNQVLEMTRVAASFELAGELDAAAIEYARALAIDPAWQPAQQGLARSRSGMAQIGYEVSMAKGYAALSQEQFAGARAGFNAALGIRPGDADALQALRAVDEEVKLAKVIRLQVEARAAEEREQWSRAIAAYDEILVLEPGLASAPSNRARALERQRLNAELVQALGNIDQFNDDRVAGRAQDLLNQAREISSPGPELAKQLKQLDDALRIAAVPVPVVFQSDNLTEVVIYKVGTLGAFLTRTIDLKPGRYVAVGNRVGYRDVRLSFNVRSRSLGNSEPIVLSCEDPI
jgi:hypothetical protein